jgi:hypothetical protein
VVVSVFVQEPAILKLTRTIPMADVKGQFDHFTMDTARSSLRSATTHWK